MPIRNAMSTALPIAVALGVLSAPIPAGAKQENIDRRAVEILTRMTSLLTSAKSYSFSWVINFDQVYETGEKLTFFRTGRHVYVRDSKLRIDIDESGVRRQFYFNGRQFVLYDPKNRLYASFSFKGNVDRLITTIRKRFRVVAPVNEFVRSTLGKDFLLNVVGGIYVETSEIEGRPLHHLAFAQKNFDWQIWISAKGPPLPVILIGTDRRKPQQPQYRIWFRKWRINHGPKEATFTFTPPKGAKQIQFIEFRKDQAGKKNGGAK